MTEQLKNIGKKVMIKKGADHPHAGEQGIVVDYRKPKGVGNNWAYVIQGDDCEFYVFNKNHIEWLEELKQETQQPDDDKQLKSAIEDIKFLRDKSQDLLATIAYNMAITVCESNLSKKKKVMAIIYIKYYLTLWSGIL